MNYKMILKSLGTVLCIVAASMVPSLLVSFIYGQGDALSFIISIAIILFVGLGLRFVRTVNTNIYTRDGFAIVALSWIVVTVSGALPYVISGYMPNFIDAIFESASGFSTTGATILRDVEALPKGILFWRSFTHWMGGMGVLVLMIAILPSVKSNTLHIMKAESTGPSPGKLVPKISHTAKILYAIYIAITLIQVLFLLAGGMPLYDSLVHAFGTASTGGFSIKNASIAAYKSVYIEMVITFFMLLCGINFTLFYIFLKGNIKSALKDEEMRFFIGTVVISALLIALNINGSVYKSMGESLRYSLFQVGSVITTTGYVTADFNLWPAFSQFILVLIMFVGGCAGSTAGGIKCVRILLLFKIARLQLSKIIHPRVVQTIKINGNVMDDNTLSGVMAFFFIYIFVFVVSVIIILFDGKDLITSTTSVAAALNNIGPGLGLVGPVGNFADFSFLSKAVFSACMILGRLEIYPILLLCLPSFWKKINI